MRLLGLELKGAVLESICTNSAESTRLRNWPGQYQLDILGGGKLDHRLLMEGQTMRTSIVRQRALSSD